MRPASSPRLVGVCVFFSARRELCFLHQLYIFHLQIIKGILRETVSVPPFNRMNVTAVNKDLRQLLLTGCRGI